MFSNKNHTYHNGPDLWQFYFLLIPSALCTWLPQHFILCNCWTGRFVYHLFHIAYVFRLHTFARNNNTCVQFMFVNKLIMMNPIHLERENQVSLCTCVENVCIILCFEGSIAHLAMFNYKHKMIRKFDYNHGFKNFQIYNFAPKMHLQKSTKR